MVFKYRKLAFFVFLFKAHRALGGLISQCFLVGYNDNSPDKMKRKMAILIYSNTLQPNGNAHCTDGTYLYCVKPGTSLLSTLDRALTLLNTPQIVLVSSADNLCKQFGPRSGPTKYGA